MSRFAFSCLLILSACGGTREPHPVPPTVAIAPAPRASASPAVPPSAPDAGKDLYEPPKDTHVEDGSLAAGTIAIDLRGPEGEPVTHETVFLAQISETPIPNVAARTDAAGRATLSAPAFVGSSARVVTHRGDAEYWTEPFPIPARGGVRVVLHSYPSSRAIDDARVVFQSVVLVEADGADVKVTQALQGYNFARVAWLPDEHWPLPKGAARFEGNVYSETSLVVMPKDGQVSFSGTLAPGKHYIEMSFIVPSPGRTAAVRIAMPPHLAVARVITWAGRGTRLEVDGFPPAIPTTSSKGEASLVTERQTKREDPPIREISLRVSGVTTAPR